MVETPIDSAADWGDEVNTDMKLYSSDSDDVDEFTNRKNNVEGGNRETDRKVTFNVSNESVKRTTSVHKKMPVVSNRILSARIEHSKIQFHDKLTVSCKVETDPSICRRRQN